MNDLTTFLMHHGVKGMKWGVRKERGISGDHAAYAAIRKKKLSNMTDGEIKTAVKRMRLVKDYNSANYVKKGRNIKSMSNDELKSAINRNQLNKIFLKKNPITGWKNIRKTGGWTDAQVKAAINRHILETQYKDLAHADIRAAKKFLRAFLQANSMSS